MQYVMPYPRTTTLPQGEYDEDMLLVQHPEEAPGGRRGRAGGRWGGQGRQADVELEGEW